MALIKQYHKDTDTTYVYESESYWDPDKKQSRSRRKVVGKIDPDTGEMIPTGKRGRKKKSSPLPSGGCEDTELKRISDLYEQATRELARKDSILSSQKQDISSLKKELSSLREENRSLKEALKKINTISGRLSV